jgi:hypothetical protein
MTDRMKNHEGQEQVSLVLRKERKLNSMTAVSIPIVKAKQDRSPARWS